MNDDQVMDPRRQPKGTKGSQTWIRGTSMNEGWGCNKINIDVKRQQTCRLKSFKQKNGLNPDFTIGGKVKALLGLK